MGRCEYIDCKNITRRIKKGKSPNISFFRFPKEKELCERWVKACQRDCLLTISVDNLHRSHVVCGLHFKDFDFANPLTKKKLRYGAVPRYHGESCVSSIGNSVIPKPVSECSKLMLHSSEINEGTGSSTTMELYSRTAESICKDLACPQQLTTIAKNLWNILPPLSPSSSELIEEESELPSPENNLVLSAISPECIAVTPEIAAVSPSSSSSSIKSLSSAEKLVECSGTSSSAGACELLLSGDYEGLTFHLFIHFDLVINLIDRQNMKFPLHTSPDQAISTYDCVCDLRGQKLDILNESNIPDNSVTHLLVDDNLLTNFTNVKLFQYNYMTELSLANNKISSLHWFQSLHTLRTLNLSGNCLKDVESFNELSQLVHLDLSHNSIKNLDDFIPLPDVEYQNLQRLNLAGNKIARICDLSVFSNLQTLNLEENRIVSLEKWKNFLPSSICSLYLKENLIEDLSDFGELTSFNELTDISVQSNPCFRVFVQNIGENEDPVSFCHSPKFRPFVKAKCPKLKKIDDIPLSALERDEAGRLITEAKILRFGRGSHLPILSALSKYCFFETSKKRLNRKRKHAAISSKKAAIGKSKNGINDEGSDGNNLDWSSSDMVDERARQNLVDLIEEKARNYKLKRENEDLRVHIRYLESFFVAESPNSSPKPEQCEGSGSSEGDSVMEDVQIVDFSDAGIKENEVANEDEISTQEETCT